MANGLRAAQFEADIVQDGDEAFTKLQGERYDGAVLDIMLPGRDGPSILRQLREGGNNVPIVLLTARGSVNERIEGLWLGADDYLPKPFSIDELVVRLQAVLRRVTGEKLTVLHYADITLNLVTREVQRARRLVDLSPREFELLEFFLRSPERVLGRIIEAQHTGREPVEMRALIEPFHPFLEVIRDDGTPVYRSAMLANSPRVTDPAATGTVRTLEIAETAVRQATAASDGLAVSLACPSPPHRMNCAASPKSSTA